MQAHDIMGKFRAIKSYVISTLDQLPVIKSNLVIADDNRHDWDFEALTKELSRWVDCKPSKTRSQNQAKEKTATAS